ncbi:MAG: excinuclease ABC subunit UvrA [Culicoidibacterales bacterium]
MEQKYIRVKGARENNLKNIDIDIPKNQLVIMTGLSGSGKTSLAFDTIYAEGQRRYVESLSAYARQFLGNMEKPDVDTIEGLSPAISIDQKTTSRNPRSTVGTMTEIYDYLRLLYARIGTPYCPNHHIPIQSQTVQQMTERLMEFPDRTKMQILAPVIEGQKGTHAKIFEQLRKDGYVRVRVDGTIGLLEDDYELEKNKKHTIEVVVDRIAMKADSQSRIHDSLEIATKLANGRAIVIVDEQEEELLFSEHFACQQCGFSVGELEPRLFSFNAPFGACAECNGLGTKMEIDPNLVIKDPDRSLGEGLLLGVSGWAVDSTYYSMMMTAAKDNGIDITKPLKDFTKKERNLILYGSKKILDFTFHTDSGQVHKRQGTYEGVITNLERRYLETSSSFMRDQIQQYMSEQLCPSCHGNRLNEKALSVQVNHQNIAQITARSVRDAIVFFETIELTPTQQQIATLVLKEIRDRLSFLNNVGIGYLNLNRMAGSLSGGEAQRIRLATQIGSQLTGVTYVLDEPSIGLHQRDNDRLIETLKRMRDLGNSIIVVEHDEDTMRAADFLIDVGPRAGIHGGEIVAAGTPAEVMKNLNSITGQYLSGEKFISVPTTRREGNGKTLVVKNARENNLKGIDITLPLGLLACVTGVSGSGKSTFVHDILYRSLAQVVNKNKQRPGAFDGLEGAEHIDKIIDIDQSPIGRTPRSNPATYTGVFDDIRDLFTQTTEAKLRGYKKGRFSFNVKGGRCEACQGDGIIKIEMHFLPDVYVPCEVCHGKRYNSETLSIHYKGKNVYDVLDMTIEEAVEFFASIPKITRKLQTIVDVGLGYVKLGQSAITLSGGEAQRVKLASELHKRPTGKTLYILDEPTTGLHIDDVSQLITVLQRIVDNGDSVLVIEHNLEVIKVADYLIDLGPEGGDEGGEIVAIGTPEQVSEVEGSYTGYYLKPLLAMHQK